MHWIYQNKLVSFISFVVLLFVFNIETFNFGLESDFFGIIFSVALFIFGARKTNLRVNYLLLILILFFEFVCYRLHTKSLHFLSIMLFICMLFHSFTSRFSFIAFICVILFSSLFNKFFEHLTTEIKQSLCTSVYHTLKHFITIEKIEGINFFWNGTKITIDTACMGLSMFKIGLFFGAVLLTLIEQKQKKYFTIVQILLFCFLIIILNIISNYFRIVILVLLKCTQENVLHHLIGLVCFGIYQIVPMLFIIRYFNPKKNEQIINQLIPNFSIIVMSFIIILITSFEIKNKENYDLIENLSSEYTKEKGTWIANDVYKIESPNKLVYIKTPSHKPLICWTGNGYKIIESRKILLYKQKVWYNVMEKNKVHYQSIWWYECGSKKYTSFIEVMFIKLFYNKPIRLINETSIMEKNNQQFLKN